MLNRMLTNILKNESDDHKLPLLLWCFPMPLLPCKCGILRVCLSVCR